MSHACQRAAVRILDWFHHAESDLLNARVITMTGDTGVVKEIRLDDFHGVCFTFDDPVSGFDEIECGVQRRWRPVSTIRQKV